MFILKNYYKYFDKYLQKCLLPDFNDHICYTAHHADHLYIKGECYI